ncbi:unnamed protein product [Mycena citricolor]|uniref:Uncharacterized protein n=1 Tax=Mycena citricolor TaxID=2018698 RepID=A0AAD2HQW2_9AGAR|nr:unnamed protein product [Mycena citricolor]
MHWVTDNRFPPLSTMRGRVCWREHSIESTGAILGLSTQMAQSIKVIKILRLWQHACCRYTRCLSWNGSYSQDIKRRPRMVPLNLHAHPAEIPLLVLTIRWLPTMHRPSTPLCIV